MAAVSFGRRGRSYHNLRQRVAQTVRFTGMTAVEVLGSVDELADRTGSSVVRCHGDGIRSISKIPVGRTRIMKPLTRLTVLGTGLLLVVLVAVGCAQRTTPGTTTTTLQSSTGAPVVMTSPGNPSVAGGVVRHVVTGEITDVDRNSGRVDIRASDGSKVQVILPPLAVATTKKGDRASIDVTLGPAR